MFSRPAAGSSWPSSKPGGGIGGHILTVRCGLELIWLGREPFEGGRLVVVEFDYEGHIGLATGRPVEAEEVVMDRRGCNSA